MMFSLQVGLCAHHRTVRRLTAVVTCRPCVVFDAMESLCGDKTPLKNGKNISLSSKFSTIHADAAGAGKGRARWERNGVNRLGAGVSFVRRRRARVG
jgi:hypothetical protein